MTGLLRLRLLRLRVLQVGAVVFPEGSEVSTSATGLGGVALPDCGYISGVMSSESARRRTRVNKQRMPAQGHPLLAELAFGMHYLSWTAGKHAGSLDTNGSKSRRVDSQGLEDGWRHLGRAHFGVDRLGLEARMGQQQHDIRVVMGEPAVLGSFLVLPV